MEDWRKYLDPEEMTPTERLERVVKLLAKAASAPDSKKEEGPTTLDGPLEGKGPCIPSTSGPIPFGKKLGDGGLEINEEQFYWIKRIQEWDGLGYSSGKIAKRLNEEDHKTKRAGKWSRTAVWRMLKRINEKGFTGLIP